MVQKHLMYIPWTGLGLFGGFRGNGWLKNRIKVFKQFVVPSLLAQTNRQFMVWCSWRPEEKDNPYVKELYKWLKDQTLLDVFFTYSGVCFYDDKYERTEAKSRLLEALHGCAPDLMNAIGECDYVLMTIQPSDDCYHKNAVKAIQQVFEETDLQAVGFKNGYIMDYTTKNVAEYNPTTNPPFYTIKFPREVFVNPLSHLNYTSLKHDVGQYPKGTPLPSHEYVKDCLKYEQIDARGFLVGTHGANISTTWQIPFKGEAVDQEVLEDFGIFDVPPVKIKLSIFRKILIRLPHKVQRKIRYWLTEKFRR
jgi:hypothetical protein